jgi:hypothetical protein
MLYALRRQVVNRPLEEDLPGPIRADAERALPIYGWSRYVCWVMIALPYVAAGLSKLRHGFFWLLDILSGWEKPL